MPMRLPKQPPCDLPGSWNERLFCTQEGEVAHKEVLHLGSFVPPGLLERLMAACYTLGHHHYFWRRPHGAGALVEVAIGESGQGDGASGGGTAMRLLFDVDELRVERPANSPPATIQEYVLRFETFTPHANAAEGVRLLSKAQALLDRLLTDFPGMITCALHGAVQWRRA